MLARWFWLNSNRGLLDLLVLVTPQADRQALLLALSGLPALMVVHGFSSFKYLLPGCLID